MQGLGQIHCSGIGFRYPAITKFVAVDNNPPVEVAKQAVLSYFCSFIVSGQTSVEC